ncbi:unnamed protein product [Hydatigera taeniaeformis]|uniref:Uncharacterized protein n=1 Tax=Hydatigena taeniaeformis TaxID=6205 RepID=A0A0R3WUA3_HYDTA|nr:unnamed protein product [Hydatigera taeniaeformis]
MSIAALLPTTPRLTLHITTTASNLQPSPYHTVLTPSPSLSGSSAAIRHESKSTPLRSTLQRIAHDSKPTTTATTTTTTTTTLATVLQAECSSLTPNQLFKHTAAPTTTAAAATVA